jgi:hypothetical protein
MPSDLDEHDLYPPDAEDAELTADAKSHRMRAAVGATLLTWGMSLIIQRALRVDVDTFVLGLGIGALAGWSQVRRYHWFVVGSVAAGLGMAEVMGAVLGGAFGSAVASLLVAAGFAAIYVRYPRRSMWALVPAAIMALIAAGSFGVGLIGLLPAVLGKFLLPLLLVSGGGLLLFRHSLPPKTVKIGLASLAGMFVLIGANSVPDIDHDPQLEFGPNPLAGGPPALSQPLDLQAGDTLVMRNDGSGNIEFRTGPARIEVEGDEPPGIVNVEPESGGRVVVGTSRMFGSDEGVDYIVTLPEGVEVDIERGSGDISGTLRNVSGHITTGSGDVELQVVEGGSEGVADDGPLDIDTRSGDVMIESDAALDLSLRSEADVYVNSENTKGRYHSPAGVVGIDLSVRSDSGDIEVEMPGAPPSQITSTSVSPATTAPSN